MDTSDKTFNKVINSIHRLQGEEERLSYALYYINRLLASENTYFIDKQKIPKRGLTRQAWQEKKSFFVNDLSSAEKYDKKQDQYGENIHSLLFFPIKCLEEYIGVLVCSGSQACTITEEEMIPLKSGDKTIGVTVKQVTKTIPAHQFSTTDISLLEDRLPELMNTVRNHDKSSSKTISATIREEKELSVEQKENFFTNTVDKIKQFFGTSH